jgi:hypothetical protein
MQSNGEGVTAMRAIRKTIHIKKSHEGLLHKDLDVPAGQPIPAAKLEKALHSSDPAERKRAQFAENASHFHHPKKDK